MSRLLLGAGRAILSGPGGISSGLLLAFDDGAYITFDDGTYIAFDE